MSDNTAQELVNNMQGIQARGIQEIIAAYEHRAETERANAHAAEAEGQLEDYDYYMDLAGEYLQKANDHRYQISEHDKNKSKAVPATESNQ